MLNGAGASNFYDASWLTCLTSKTPNLHQKPLSHLANPPLLQLRRRAVGTARRRRLLLTHMFHLALQPQALGPCSLQLLLQLLRIRRTGMGGGSSQRCCLCLLECGLQAGHVTLSARGREGRT